MKAGLLILTHMTSCTHYVQHRKDETHTTKQMDQSHMNKYRKVYESDSNTELLMLDQLLAQPCLSPKNTIFSPPPCGDYLVKHK